MPHIIFDLDGTIIDSKPEILRTYRVVFDQVPPNVFPDLDSLNYGLTLNNLLKSVYGEAEHEKIKEARAVFASVYDTSDYDDTLLYEGVIDTLAWLKNQGNIMYIATNKRLFPTNRILEAKGLAHFFSGIMANEMQPGITPTKRQMIAALKAAGAFESGYMVGDSVTDIAAGNEEQLITVAVNYGYEQASLLAAEHPIFSIDHFDKLCSIVQG